MVPAASASFLDSDFYCRTKGCVIVHDGVSFDVYDVHIFATNGTVPRGGRLIPWTGNPFQGTGQVNPVFTGSVTEGFHVIATSKQGVTVGIDATGNGTIDQSSTGDTNGLLDAEDAFNSFNITENTTLRAAQTSIRRSFYLSSRTEGFLISARAALLGTRDALNQVATLENVKFDYGITQRGRDGNLRFGNAANDGGYRRLGNINNLSPLSNAPQYIAEFPDAIRSRSNNSLPAQSVRFDYVYGFEGYDLSLGAGNLQYEIEFDFYRSN